MMGKDNRSRVLAEFFKCGSSDEKGRKDKGEGLQLREIGRSINLAPTSVKKYLKELESKGLVIKKLHSESNYPIYFPNLNNSDFKYLKNLYILHALKELGLIEYVEKECSPEVMVVSGAGLHDLRGDSTRDSGEAREIKLFLACKEKRLELGGYEKDVGVKITPIFLKDFSDLTPELEEEIINGIVLKGVLRLIDVPIASKQERKREQGKQEELSSKKNEKEKEEGFYSRMFSEEP